MKLTEKEINLLKSRNDHVIDRVLEDAQRREDLKNLGKKYKNIIDLEIKNQHTKKVHNIPCIIIDDHIAVGKCVGGKNFTLYAYRSEGNLSFGIYGKKLDMIERAKKIADLGLTWNNSLEAHNNVQNDKKGILRDLLRK